MLIEIEKVKEEKNFLKGNQFHTCGRIWKCQIRMQLHSIVDFHV